jgi:hypothetical protein
MTTIFPIDVEAIAREALRGSGPDYPEPLPDRPRRQRLSLPPLRLRLSRPADR